MSIANWIADSAARWPDKAAIRFHGRELSWRQFAALADDITAALAAAGVRRGDAVAFLGFNSPEMLALLFSCARLGALYMPLNWRLAAPEHRQMLADCPPRVLIVERDFVAPTAALGDALEGMHKVAINGEAAEWQDWDGFLAAGTAAPPRDPAIAADAPKEFPVGDTPLLICYTSGSTGKPKGVLLSQGALEVNAGNSEDMHGLTADDVIFNSLPLFHVGGLNNLVTPGIKAGCTLVLHAKFEPAASFDAIESEGITLTVLVPAQLDMMMASPRWAGADFSGLRMITTGSTIVPRHVIDAVHAKGVPLVQVYGSTETSPIAVYLKADEAMKKPGSTGRVGKHCRMRLVDKHGRDVAPGETGEIWIKGGNVMSGYWKAPQATAAVLEDGWFRSGDMGHLDEDGYLWVDGRSKDMIISGGENIYPAEIENILIESPDIAEASVIGKPDPRWGEIVVAVVVPKSGHQVARDQVLGMLEGRIARFKHPKEVVIVQALPKTALGKIRKDDVRQMVAR